MTRSDVCHPKLTRIQCDYLIAACNEMLDKDPDKYFMVNGFERMLRSAVLELRKASGIGVRKKPPVKKPRKKL